MPGTDQPSNRRTVLKLLGSGVATVGGVVHSAAASGRDTTVETLRGSSNSPLTSGEIRERRNRIVEDHAAARSDDSRLVLTDVAETVGDSRVLAYNIISDGAGVPREQFATRDGAADAPGVGAQQTDRLHDEADEMLERATSQNPTPEISTRSRESWYEWRNYGHTDVVHEFPRAEFGARPGRVSFENSVRRDRDADRIGARTQVRMDPGRQLCAESGIDGFCTSPVHVEYRNKSAEVVQDWDMPANSVPTEQLLTGIHSGKVADTEETRLALIDLDVSRSGPARWVGYESSVSVPGAELIDATTFDTGQSRHKFNVDSPASNSAINSATFEFGSVARWDADCSGGLDSQTILTVDTDFEWGLDVPIVTWGVVVSHSRKFTYTTYC